MYAHASADAIARLRFHRGDRSGKSGPAIGAPGGHDRGKHRHALLVYPYMEASGSPKMSVALVTGGGRGIGRAVARALASDGYAVAVLSRTRSELEQTARDIVRAGGTAIPVVADVARTGEVARAVAQARALGEIDLLVNNAGVGGPIGVMWNGDPDAWWRAVEINLRGTFNCVHSVLPGMVDRGRGRIINVASDAGAYRWPLVSHYSVAKAAVIKLTENLAAETRRHGVAAFAIHPGLVRVGLTELSLHGNAADGSPEASVQAWVRRQVDEGLAVEPERACGLVLRLASGEADELSGRYITVHDDLEDLLAQAEDIRRSDSHVLRRR
jgi:NAD(P)-dependent dehydrogenase (short-subunit alcohol dehydrogenase family)